MGRGIFKLKKVFAILTVLALLQNYGLILGNAVIAQESIMFKGGEKSKIEESFMNEDDADTTEEVEETEDSLREDEDLVDKEEEKIEDEKVEDTVEAPDEEFENPEEIIDSSEDTTGEEDNNPENTTGEEEITSEDTTGEEIEETIPDEVIHSSIFSENSSIYKGYFYANIVSDNKYETSYNYTDTIEILDAKYINEIDIEEEGDNFLFETGVDLGIGENTYYRAIQIKEEEMDPILGVVGYIEIYTKDGEYIGRIDSSTLKEDDSYVYYFDVEISEIEIKIMNPVNPGTLNIKRIKAIKSELEYSRRQIELFRYIETKTKTTAIYDDENIWEQDTVQNLINLEETESRMDLELNTSDFSTMLQNQVTFTVTMKTNEERYDLFQNPTIEILMPSAVEDVEITSINLLYKNDLSLEDWEVTTNDAGKKVIRVYLSGTQTEYTPGSMQEGTTLVIYTNIDVNKLTSNTNEKIKMTYTNENSSKLYYEVMGNETEDTDIRFVAKEGILKSSSISNYNAALDSIFEFNDEVVMGSLDVGSNSQTATVSMAVVNNYEKDLDNVTIIGRIPGKGITDADGNTLATTVDTSLLSAIAYSGSTGNIYYSYELDADEDSDSWMEIVTDFSLVKSYKIELENPMLKGDRAEFSYQISIPEDLNYNETMYSTYQVNYYIDGQLLVDTSTIGLATETREIVLEDAQEQIEQEVTVDDEQENLSIGVTVTKGGEEVEEGEEIFERQILRYTVILKNTTSKPLTNLTIKGKAANSNLYYMKEVTAINYSDEYICKIPVEDDGTKKYEELKIENLDPEEIAKLEYQVIVNEVEENSEKEVYGEIVISADNLDEIKIETSKNRIKQANLELRVELGDTETLSGKDLFSNADVKYLIKIKNISSEVKENVELNIMLPESLEYDIDLPLIFNDDVERRISKSPNGNVLTFLISDLQAGEIKEFYIEATVKGIDLNTNSELITILANAIVENEKYISNDYIKPAYQTQTAVEVEFLSNPINNSEVQDKDEIEFSLNIKNIGILDDSLNIWYLLPSGLEIIDANLEIDGVNENVQLYEKYFNIEKELKSGSNMNLKMKTRVNSEKLELDQEYIENYFEIEGENISKEKTDIINFKVINNSNNDTTEEKDDASLKKVDEPKEERIEAEIPTVSGEKNNNSANNNVDPNNETGNIENDNNQKESIDNNGNKENTIPNNEIDSNNSITENSNIENKNTIRNTTTNNNIQNSIADNNAPTSSKVKHKISGKIWIDSNKDGKQDSNEEKLSNVTVRLYKSTNGTSVVYNTSNLMLMTKTDSSGNYEFKNLENGYYLVMAEYNSEDYNVTEYKLATVGETTNSDFISKQITINGNKQEVAISDILQIESSNISYIDLGLTYKDEVDIEIKKSIASIKVEDDERKETITYNESELAKLEIAPKKLKKTKLTIIYEFEIKNSGDLEAYVTNIVDRLPEGLKFDEKNNSGWYLSDDGSVHNLSLTNTKIQPGKSQKLKLALTKQMDEDSSLGSYVNEVEVLETTNDKKLQETNLENNKAKVELLLTVKTGRIILYSGIIATIATISALIVFLIKKKIIKLKPVYK